MLFTQGNSFNWSADNFGATLGNTTLGTQMTANGTANVKGTAVSLLAGSSVTEDVYGVALLFCGGSVAAATRNFLADLLIDPAGGTSWSTLIANLLVRSPNLANGGNSYFFPLFLKNGTSIGMQQQCSTGGATLRAGVRLFGKPTRPEMLRCGSKVETYGANTGTSGGTAITPGTNAQGSYTASLGTVAGCDKWWWQCGMGMADTSGGEKTYFYDVAVGDASNKKLAAQYMKFFTDENEQAGNGCFGMVPPCYDAPVGDNVYMRGWASTTPDSSITVAAYGLG